MDTSLESLDPSFRPKAEQLLNEAKGKGILLRVINTRRTATEQAINLKNGVSWVQHSKHQDGLAIDVCPYELLHEKGWKPESPLWQQIGEIGKSLGLKWGGDWKVKDLGHFEA